MDSSSTAARVWYVFKPVVRQFGNTQQQVTTQHLSVAGRGSSGRLPKRVTSGV
ncbi:hypothetical protein PDG61_06855 [Mycolicibacterium sp. BiH015]|uniref:hypothetical protein n=1 Tax=Mycolicibacterium sp. BiH015 TaxID=3018808 RepID=UPI0022E0FCC3|nr:hypothetical protein [Mycolicibacterium sp. BiH015]MDA2890623.1 hypothetical protein [Mycolicibacterium sp. BiH015]